MSDSHSEQRSPKGIIRRYGGGMASLLSRRLESNAGRARRSSEFHHRHEYGHASRFLPDCRIGFSECRPGFPDCRPGWRNVLEEPLSHSKTAMPSKRHESVEILPSSLSSLLASSNSRASRKDVCRRKFPLPAEPDDGKTKSLSPEEPELSPTANMVPCKPVALRVAAGTWDDSPPFTSLDDFASYDTVCENAFQDRHVALGDANESSLQNFGVSSRDANESSIQTLVERLGDSNESSLQTFNTNAIQTFQTFGGKYSGEVSKDAVVSLGGFSTQALESYSHLPVVMQHACVSTEDLNERAVMSPFFDSSCEEQSSRNSIGTCSNKNAAVGGVSIMEGTPGSFRLPPSRTLQWDDWWTCQRDECNGQGGHSVNRTMLGHEVKQQFLTPAKINAMERADEEDLEEGYLILDEHGNRKEGSTEADGGGDGEGYDGDDEGYTLQVLDVKQQNDAYDTDDNKGDDKEVDGGICSENISKAFKEDDIWSDEDLISSQVKGFPPPISILANETHPGLPGHMPRTFWRSVKRGGRFVLQEVQARPREFFQATRENGRLQLQLVRPDSDPGGAGTDTLDTLQPDEVGTEDQGETSGAGSSPDSDLVGRVTETLNTSHVDVGGTECKGESAGVGPGQNGTNQISEKVLGVRTTLDTGLKEIMDQIGTRQITERKEISNCDQRGTNNFSEMTLEVKTPSDAGQKETMDQTGTDQITERKETLGPCQNSMKQISEKTIGPLDAGQKETRTQISADRITRRMESFGPDQNGTTEKMSGVRTLVDAGWVEITDQIGRDQITEREDSTKLDARQSPDSKELESCSHSRIVTPTGHANEEQFRQDYQHACFNSTYGFDNTLNVLSPSQTLLQFPIQPAVR